MRTPLVAVGGLAICFALNACSPANDDATEAAAGGESTPAADVPQLVRPDGSYPTKPLEKDIVVLKVVQNTPQNLQDAPSVEEGLAENVKRMGYWINKACTEGKKPDFILFNEFPLTGYSTGTRNEKLKFTIQIPGPETEAIGELARESLPLIRQFFVSANGLEDDAFERKLYVIRRVVEKRLASVSGTFHIASLSARNGGPFPTTAIGIDGNSRSPSSKALTTICKSDVSRSPFSTGRMSSASATSN